MNVYTAEIEIQLSTLLSNACLRDCLIVYPKGLELVQPSECVSILVQRVSSL